MSRFVMILLAGALFAGMSTVTLAQQSDFSAWRAQCDGGRCSAETVTPGGRALLLVEREAAGSPWTVVVDGIGNDVRPGSTVRLSVDGRRAIGFRANGGYDSRGEAVILSDPALQPVLIDSLLAGNRANVAFVHSQGLEIKLGFSLSGLSAAMRWIDGQQGGGPETPLAEQSDGPVPVEPVPAQPAPSPEQDTPSESAAVPGSDRDDAQAPPPDAAPEPDRKAERQDDAPLPPVEVPTAVEDRHLADGECRDYGESHMKEARVSDALDKNHTLYLLPCYSGAYNVVYRAWVVDSREPKEVRRELFVGYTDDLGWHGKDTLINADYDRKTKTLKAFEKGRGLGDCGSIPTYRWHKDFWRLLELRNWERCDGTRLPEKWPIVFQHPDYDAR